MGGEIKINFKKADHLPATEDLSSKEKMIKRLEEKNLIFKSILNSIQDGISVLHKDLTIRYTNSKMQQWYSASNPLEGKKCYSAYQNRDTPCPGCPSLKTLETGEVQKRTIPGSSESDTGFFEVSSYPIFDKQDNNGDQIIGVVELIQDISGRKKREKKIKYLFYKDALTDLYNRRFFAEEMQRLDTERQLPLSIIMGDINGLKIINDSLGHKKGDEYLKKAAQIFKDSTRSEDIVARFGGDEFAILLPQTTVEETNIIYDRIKEKCLQTEMDKFPISIGLGSATKKSPEQDIEKILTDADDSMYQDKLSNSSSHKKKMIQVLLDVLSSKSQENQEHILRMCRLAKKMGNRIGLSSFELNKLNLLATLHDIGKVSLPQEILLKKGELTSEEFEKVRAHSRRGYHIASVSDEFARVSEEILSHHEHWDGGGYPRGLAGEEIPVLARIIAIIDAYEVMVHERPYSDKKSKEEALKEIQNCAGTQFDPELAEKFTTIMKEEE